MMSFKTVIYLSISFGVVSLVYGQLAPGSNTYLPPTTNGYKYPSPPSKFTPPSPPRPTPPGPRPPAPPGQRPPPRGEPGPDHVHVPGMPFDFEYAVNDIDTANDYSHKASSNGDVTTGEYRVQMPDGRTQIVRYTADWKTGFHAEVSYEGQPQGPGGRPGYKY